jgi:hypothetical protein
MSESFRELAHYRTMPRTLTVRTPPSQGRPAVPRAGSRLYTHPVPSVTDYALARRAVLRDFRSGALTRLDVCDAHPELMRAAQNIGVAITDQCPVCGDSNLRLVSYVYGEKLKQANGRAISDTSELLKLGASCDEFACYDVEVCLDCRWNHLRRQSLHGRLHAS